MDPLTHILLGANLGYAAFGRKLARTAAGVAGLAAFAPDIDVFIQSAADPLVAIEHHRGFTHALAFAPVGAAVVATFWLARAEWRTWARWRLLWACALLGYASHALLDAATTYGTQLLWPLDRTPYALGSVFIIDPLYTLPLLVAVLVVLCRAKAERQRRALGSALVLSSGYLLWSLLAQSWVTTRAQAMLAQLQLPASSATPNRSTPLRSSDTPFTPRIPPAATV